MENVNSLSKIRKFFDAYESLCKPYCQEIGISVQAFEILLYISKNKKITTAQEICKEQNIKPTLMSFHIEKLVQAGLIERRTIDGNRRSISLVCTDAAAPIIAKGAEINKEFTRLVWEGIPQEEVANLFATLAKVAANVDKMVSENK